MDDRQTPHLGKSLTFPLHLLQLQIPPRLSIAQVSPEGTPSRDKRTKNQIEGPTDGVNPVAERLSPCLVFIALEPLYDDLSQNSD